MDSMNALVPIFCDSSQIVDPLVLGHASAEILDGDVEIGSSEMILKKKFGCASIFPEPVMKSWRISSGTSEALKNQLLEVNLN